VIGYGTVSELVTPAEKLDGLQVIMRQYSGREWEFRREDVEAVKVWKLEIESMTGKQSKDH
jgi:nitroimidazol reductase NimA-like FMN-containing flavoprotein (pyridoxamine 5'-phosphate oxidase superfamily)